MNVIDHRRTGSKRLHQPDSVIVASVLFPIHIFASILVMHQVVIDPYSAVGEKLKVKC